MTTDRDFGLVVIGAGRHGCEVFSYLHDLRTHGHRLQFVGFVDEGLPRGPWPRGAAEVLGGFDELRALLKSLGGSKLHYITACGDNRMRRDFVRKVEELDAKNLVPWSLHHPRAVVGSEVQIGEGACLAPGSILTTRVKIGRHCIVNVNASISHDCVIGDFVNINPGAVVCGEVILGEGCYVGAGATIIDKISIGAWTVIGAGSVVTQDIPPNVTAVGVPSRVIKSHPVLV